jgi:hypothetical protein
MVQERRGRGDGEKRRVSGGGRAREEGEQERRESEGGGRAREEGERERRESERGGRASEEGERRDTRRNTNTTSECTNYRHNRT